MNEVGDGAIPLGQLWHTYIKISKGCASGLIMTDAIHEEISNVLIMQKENEVFSQALASWESTLNISYNEENIELATKEAEARMAQEDKSGEKTKTLKPFHPKRKPKATDSLYYANKSILTE